MKYLYIFENASATSVFHYSFCHDNLLPACLWDTPHAQSVSNKGLEALLFYTLTEAIHGPDHNDARHFSALLSILCYTYLNQVALLYVHLNIHTTFSVINELITKRVDWSYYTTNFYFK